MKLSERIESISLSVAMDMYAAGLAVNTDGDYQVVANMIEHWVTKVRKLEAVAEAVRLHKQVDWKFDGVVGFHTWDNVLEALAELEAE